MQLQQPYSVAIGVGGRAKKAHRFDLGNERVLVECKTHKWTKAGNVPSAKMTVWNEAMYYFALAPKNFKKIFFVLRDFSDKRGCTLAEYYIATCSHLIPESVEIWEYDESEERVKIFR